MNELDNELIDDELLKKRKYFREYMRKYNLSDRIKQYHRDYYMQHREYLKEYSKEKKLGIRLDKKEIDEYNNILKDIDLSIMSTFYCTINLAKYILQPWKGLPRLYQLMQLIPNELTHMYFTVNKLLKEYFSGDVRGLKFIAYKDGENYWVDLVNNEEGLEQIKKKPCMKMVIKDGKIKISM